MSCRSRLTSIVPGSQLDAKFGTAPETKREKEKDNEPFRLGYIFVEGNIGIWEKYLI